VQAARAAADSIVVSIFVNPSQFGPNEDFARYPRMLEQDCERLAVAGVDAVFAPATSVVYPNGLEQHCRVSVPRLESILCGASRPGHFAGVATVVTKLFNMVAPDVAYFGRKDYQQLLVIQRLTADLCFPIEVRALDTVRDADGLALSSRNSYLSASERAIAPVVYGTLCAAADMVRAAPYLNPDNLAAIERRGMDQMSSKGLRPDYFVVRRATDLEPPAPEDKDIVVLTAAWLGATRLIDNVAVHKLR
jgi:pantoate--beta-alanine ligase